MPIFFMAATKLKCTLFCYRYLSTYFVFEDVINISLNQIFIVAISKMYK